MAIRAQTPIIPITILDSDKIQPPGKYGVQPGCIRVLIHDPISTAGAQFEDRKRIVQLTRDAIASALD